jgi:hypothetical protein
MELKNHVDNGLPVDVLVAPVVLKIQYRSDLAGTGSAYLIDHHFDHDGNITFGFCGSVRCFFGVRIKKMVFGKMFTATESKRNASLST